MEDDHATKATASSGIAINSRYYAFTDDYGLHLRSFSSSTQWTRRLQKPIASAFKHSIAFSETAQHRLAVSAGDRILIFDAETGAQTHVLSGNFRVITTLGWASHDPDVLAAGAIDGSVSLWTLQQTSCPFWQLPRCGKSCQALAFNRVDGDILASAHGSEIAIWSRKSAAKPIHILSVGRSRVIRLAWHRVIPGRLLTATNDDAVRVWDVSHSISNAETLPMHKSDDDDIFGGMEDVGKSIHPIANLQYNGRVRTARWLGEHGLVVLAEDEDLALCYSFGADWEMLHEVWRLKLDSEAATMVVHHRNGALTLTCVSELGSESHRIPAAVMDSVGGDVQLPAFTVSVDAHDFAQPNNAAKDSRAPMPLKDPMMGIAPLSIATLREQQGSFVKTSKQIQQRRRTGSDRSKQTAAQSNQDNVSTPATPSSRAMTASLELPKAHEASVSPMPFLSPTIPAKRPSPHSIPPIEETLELPPQRHASLDSMTSGGPDSDSDDESFANGMLGSGTLLPGGINVPLPRTCGAVFTQSGELVTFFKPRPRPPSPNADRTEVGRGQGGRSKAGKVASLFSTFGNLIGDTGRGPSSSATSDSDPSEAEGGNTSSMPILGLQASSYNTGQSWSNKTAPTKPAFNAAEGQHTVIVTLYSLGFALVPFSRSMAAQYQIYRGPSEAGMDVCRHNATVAEQIGHVDAAHIWNLAAILLEDTVPLRMLASENEHGDDLLIMASKLESFELSDSGVQLESAESLMYGRLRWADSPLGREWLIRQIMEWAERCADAHMLAYLSAIMAEAHQDVPLQHSTMQQTLFTELPTFGPDYELHYRVRTSSAVTDRPVPVLRTSSYGHGTVQSSPEKPRQSSQASSRAHSQPTTPFLDPTTSTPPPIPYMPKQSSRLSASGSGSASPEHHRSSFSAAARHYAQSITDKFAQYGTSPPVKKLSGSPSTNELSTSLPTASGSWSKSVSFASTLDKTRDGPLSRSYASNEDGYDSERTIDDTSLPHTPKSPYAHVGIKLLNQSAFSDSASGCAKVPLLPTDLAAKATLWRHYYAEQLRCWGMSMQAAELEKVSGLTGQVHDTKAVGVYPDPESKTRSATCAMCLSLIDNLAHLCPLCLHTTHLSCLDSYLLSLNGDPYECPAGCGCNCDDLAVQQVDVDDADSTDVKSTRTVAKKRSFTDPERSRARLEAESL